LGIPIEYMEIKDYIEGYMTMQKITAAFENSEMENSYKAILFEDESEWKIVLSEKKDDATLDIRFNYNRYSMTNMYGAYMNKFRKHIYLKFTIKSTSSFSINNFLYEKVIKKLRVEKLVNSEIIIEDLDPYSYGVKRTNIRIDLSDDINYVEQFSTAFNIIQQYNYKVYDKLITKWNNQCKKELSDKDGYTRGYGQQFKQEWL